MERVAVDQLAVAERETPAPRPVAVDREPDHVDRPDRALVRRLTRREAVDRLQPVPVSGRVLEALLRGGRTICCSSVATIVRVSPDEEPITASITSP